MLDLGLVFMSWWKALCLSSPSSSAPETICFLSLNVSSPVASGSLSLSSLSKKVQALAEAFPWLRHFLPVLHGELTQEPFPAAP